jgi:hypothetical protein
MNNNKAIFKTNQIKPGILYKKLSSRGGYHPPKKNIVIVELAKIMFAYSPKKKRAKGIDEYSTLYPETSSASASGKSNG